MVPYATADFYDSMYNIINNYSSPDIIEDELDYLCKEGILPSLINICCQGTGIDEKTFRNNYLNMKMFSTRIYWDLFCGDIPIFHLRYECDSENKVYQVGYLDDQPFFTQKMCIGTIDSLVQDFEAKMRWLATAKASDALREFIES